MTWFDLPSSVFLHEFTGPLEAVVKYDCDNEHTSVTSNTAITEMQMRKNMFVVIRKFHHRNPNCHQKSSNQGILKRQILFLSFTLPTLFIFYIGINFNAKVSIFSLIISHFGMCSDIVQNVFLLNWYILIISQYYMYVIKFRSTSQIIHLFYLFHVSFDCVY